jgi:hypothetical protein
LQFKVGVAKASDRASGATGTEDCCACGDRARTDQSTASVNSLIRIKFHGGFFVGMVLVCRSCRIKKYGETPTSIGGHGPAIEPLTLGPLKLPAVSRPFRNLAARGSLRFGTDGMFTTIVRRLPSRRSRVETGYIRIAEPRPVRNCAFSELTVGFTVGFMAAGHRLCRGRFLCRGRYLA